MKEKMKKKKIVVQGSAPYPTRTTVGVTGLCGDALIEIELIAEEIIRLRKNRSMDLFFFSLVAESKSE